LDDLVQRNVQLRQHALGSLQTDLYHSEEEVQHLEEALKLQNQLAGKTRFWPRSAGRWK